LGTPLLARRLSEGRKTDIGPNFLRLAILQVEHTGIGEQNIDRQTEQTKPMSTTFLWQKHAARKSTWLLLGTVMIERRDAEERKDIIRV